ncbi:MAG: hypothetical protein JOY80_01255, partial [Candidatus Dormibacteraeota bacterium]|nr:hypothetical protein [Candidatus Dormibacteraeota bacterium]
MNRVIELEERDWFPQLEHELAPEAPNLLEEMDTLARSIAARRTSSVERVLDEGRAQLQRRMEAELDRLAGRLMTEVALAPTPRAKLGRAIAHGATLLSARPTNDVVSQCSDPVAFVARCRAATGGLIAYIAAALNQSLVSTGQQPI